MYALMQPTVRFFDDPEGLKLHLHVFLDHQGAKHLEVVCSQNWLEHRLNNTNRNCVCMLEPHSNDN